MAALGLASQVAARPADPVSRARAAMGGAALLARVRAIGWTGTAAVLLGARTLRLGIKTRVEPFVRARSESWIIADGPATARTLVIEGSGGCSYQREAAGAARAASGA